MHKPNYGITLELAGLQADLDEADRDVIARAFVASIGRALELVEEKHPVGPYKIFAKMTNRDLGSNEEGDITDTPATVRIVIQAMAESRIVSV